MDVAQAVTLFWAQVARSSLRRVAKDVGVGHTTASGWKNGTLPEGENREKLLAWAEGQPSAEPADILREAVRQTGENLARLSEIKGMADAVLRMLRSVTDQQQRVVDSLSPWSSAEGRVLAAEALAAAVPAEDLEKIRESVRRSAAPAASPKAKKRASGER